MKNPCRQLSVVVFLLCSCAFAYGSQPNILLIVADDLGFADLGSYGGEISTPNLDALAERGTQFTNFHVAPSCSITRAMLLSGQDSHLVGMGSMHEVLDLFPQLHGKAGYAGVLDPDVRILPEFLLQLGYSTSIVGKWHLGHQSSLLPDQRGFERSFVMPYGAANHFNSQGYDQNHPAAKYYLDGIEAGIPAQFYSTDFYTDLSIQWIGAAVEEGRPFFHMLSYTAPHWPLQAPQEEIEKYITTYADGWDFLREQRYLRAVQLGLVNNAYSLPTRWENVPAWESLTEEQKAFESKMMAVYAAMVDRLDMNIGRILNELSKRNVLENTIVVFMSDNGPDSGEVRRVPVVQDWIEAMSYDNRLANLGSADSFATYHLGWAQVSAAPYHLHKMTVAEGGIRVPLIIANMNDRPPNRTDVFVDVLDLLPSLVEAAADQPGDIPVAELGQLAGGSIPELLAGVEPSGDGQWRYAIEHVGSSAIYYDKWKLLRVGLFFGQVEWRLHNMIEDPQEQIDLSEEEPDIFQMMMDRYQTYSDRVGVVPL